MSLGYIGSQSLLKYAVKIVNIKLLICVLKSALISFIIFFTNEILNFNFKRDYSGYDVFIVKNTPKIIQDFSNSQF